MDVRFCDELGFGFGWVAAEPSVLERASHALAADGRVWIFDPVEGDGVAERIVSLGEPAAVVQLLDRHSRDCAAFAARLGVPHHEVPFDGVPESPFEVISVARKPGWREVAAWWARERLLVCGDALGTTSYFRSPGELLAVHPLLRLAPPRQLARLGPRHVLVGHGEGVHGQQAEEALREALASSRRRLPRWLAGLVKKERK